MTAETRSGSMSVLDTTWESQRLWSMTANRLKRSLHRARNIVLGLIISGAALVTLSATAADIDTPLGRFFGCTGAIALALAAVVAKRSADQANVRQWVRARSTSEGLKTEIYCYLTASGVYANSPDPDGTLATRRSQLVAKVDDLGRYASRVVPPAKPRPPVHDLPSYVEHRVSEQIGWYRERARELSNRLTRFRWAEYALTAAAAAIGAAGALLELDEVALWVPVATTGAAAVAAHIAAERYEHLVLSYFATARKLTDLRDQWARGAATDAKAFVVECESTISAENQGWMADWLEEDPGARG